MSEACPICQCNNVNFICRWSDNFCIYSCDSCTTLYTYPMPSLEQITNYYQGFLYRLPSKNEFLSKIGQAKNDIRTLFKIGTLNVQEKTFLDYGGGTGIKAAAAKELGFQVYYYDVDNQAAKYVKETFNVVTIDFENLNQLKFDYIFADNVIEHCDNPYLIFKLLYKILKPNGVLIIKTPNLKSTDLFFFPTVSFGGYFRKILKYNNFPNAIKSFRVWSCDPPRHLYSFSKKSFKTIALNSGISNFEIKYYSISLLEYSIISYFFTKRYRKINIIKLIILFILLPFEFLTKVIQLFLRCLNLTTPAGLFIRISKLSQNTKNVLHI